MSLNVLWVDDEPQSLRYERILADQQGWNITSADTVSRAMELINNTAFDLVVIDLILPLDDFQKQRGYVTPDAGIQFVEAITEPTRKGSTPANVPLLVISAVISDEHKAKVVKKLVSTRYYLNKPVQEDIYRNILMELTHALE
jgi:CheY-like chemotaxis protein